MSTGADASRAFLASLDAELTDWQREVLEWQLREGVSAATERLNVAFSTMSSRAAEAAAALRQTVFVLRVLAEIEVRRRERIRRMRTQYRLRRKGRW